MLKHTITYQDYEGQTVTRNLYFNLSKQEMIQLEFKYEGGLEAKMNAIAQARNGSEIMRTIEEVVKLTYGERRGSNFIKTEAAWEDFRFCAGWDDWFFQLVTDADKASAFVNGVVDRAMLESAGREIAERAERQEQVARTGQDPAQRYSTNLVADTQRHLQNQAQNLREPDAVPVSQQILDQAGRNADERRAEDSFYRRPPHEH